MSIASKLNPKLKPVDSDNLQGVSVEPLFISAASLNPNKEKLAEFQKEIKEVEHQLQIYIDLSNKIELDWRKGKLTKVIKFNGEGSALTRPAALVVGMGSLNITGMCYRHHPVSLKTPDFVESAWKMVGGQLKEADEVIKNIIDHMHGK